jgi:3-oxoacyl-[acyl-carrier-protein] synthase II
MRLALADAGIHPEHIGYICAHGTGTKLNDLTETLAIKEAFGSHALALTASSPKSMIGHLVGAAGAFGVVLSALAVRDRRVPPTANLTEPDPDCDLDYVPLTGRAVPDLRAALCNAFGFGGSSASIIVSTPN